MSAKKKWEKMRGRFLAIPHVVLESPAYIGLSHPAKALLFDIAMQYSGINNGALVATDSHLSGRGWKSHDTAGRALSELLAACLVCRTRRGRRPNVAALYALTWRRLDPMPDMEEAANFREGAYLDIGPMKIEVLTPPDGVVLPRQTG